MRTSAGTELRSPGALLLVSCYELGHQPQGIASPLAFLSRAGYAPATLDVAVEPFDPDRVRAARFVGISVPMHTALRLGVRLSRRVRELNPSAHICFYGMYAQLHAEHLLRDAADSILGGEYETELVDLVRAIESGRPPGAARFRLRRETPEPPQRQEYIVPSRVRLPPLERYAHLEHAGSSRVVGQVEASRGCLHDCLHCPVPAVYGGRLLVVPLEVVLEDVRQQVRAGAQHITFGDADFLNGPSHSLRIVRAMHEEFPQLTFDFTAKIEHLVRERERLPELAELGALFVISAVESISDAVLTSLKKGHTRADVVEALRIVRGAGMAMRPSLLPFTPWETLEGYADLLDFVEMETLIDAVDPVHFSIRLLVPPGSLLLSSPAMQPHLGEFDSQSLSHAWTHPDPRMDALQREVSLVVEKAAAEHEDAQVTFYRIRVLAAAATRGNRLGRPGTPRLSEPWFCCAEPTSNQLGWLEASESTDARASRTQF